ncbi:MAG TPA: Asp-tRNA(Asn)/Glu-tRNA(Gln) amidotransferase subunit GatB [bacterium]|nr:Asp-tRNA(Asn)/Glu-tRNA(Gln) amidotransferase subunit GatB [bacterium]
MTKIDQEEMLGKYKLVLGLEIHLHVNVSSKMFCNCSTEGIYSASPNSRVCPVCLGLPGALPVPNKEAVEKTHLLGLALNCKINTTSRFDRKHYFYPDLPKGYQISQYKQPLCEGGFVSLPNGGKVELERIHLEEDTAKSFHAGELTLIDFNKSGMALIEMVTKPSIYNVEDAVEYAKQIQEIVRFLGVGDADMEKGQLRVEPNISLRTEKMQEIGELPNYKVEVKNINSFRFLEKAIVSEIKRQKELLDLGKTPIQENRGFNESTGNTISQRSKEEAHDYRYFPDPDIPPMSFDENYISNIKLLLRPLPLETRNKIMQEFGATLQETSVIYQESLEDLIRDLKTHGIEFKSAIKLLVNNPNMRSKTSVEIAEYINKTDSTRINDLPTLEEIVSKIMQENPEIVNQIQGGKTSAIEFLVGQVMRETKGTANAQLVREILNRNLSL